MVNHVQVQWLTKDTEQELTSADFALWMTNQEPLKGFQWRKTGDGKWCPTQMCLLDNCNDDVKTIGTTNDHVRTKVSLLVTSTRLFPFLYGLEVIERNYALLGKL